MVEENENVVVEQDQYGNYRVISGETQTIGEAYTSAKKARGGSGGGSTPSQSIGELQKSGQLQEEIKKRKAAQDQAQQKAQDQAEKEKALTAAAIRQEIRIIKGQERPAEQAARIERITAGAEETPFIRLARRRQAELLAEAGPEAELAHFPQTFVKEEKSTAVIGVQVAGKKKKINFDKLAEFPYGDAQRKSISEIKKDLSQNKFKTMAEFPYGDAQRKSISEIKEDLRATREAKKLAGFETRIIAGSKLYQDMQKMRDKGINLELKDGDIPLIPLSKGLDRIETLASLATGGGGAKLEDRGFAGGLAQGGTQALMGGSFYAIEALTYAPEVITKAALSIEGAIRKETREATIKESKASGRGAFIATAAFVTTGGGAGFLLGAGLTAGIAAVSKPPKIIQYENVKFRVKTEGVIKTVELGVRTAAGKKPKLYEFISTSGKLKVKLGFIPKDVVTYSNLPIPRATTAVAVRTLGVQVGQKALPLLSLKTQKTKVSVPKFAIQTQKTTQEKTLKKDVDIFNQDGLTIEQEIELRELQNKLELKEITQKQYNTKSNKIISELPKSENLFTTTTKTEVSNIFIKGTAKETKRELIFGTGKPKEQIQLGDLKSAIPPPITAVSTEVIQNIFNLTPKERIRISSAQKQIEILRGEKGLTVKQALFNVKQFKDVGRASKAIEKVTAKFGGVFFGTGTMQQLPEGFRLVPGDVDIRFPKLTEKALSKKVIPAFEKELVKAGEEVTIGKDILSFEISGEKVLEVKAGKGPISGEVAPEGGIGFLVDETPVKFGKAKATKAGEQLKRKGIASTYFRPADTTGAAPIEFAGPGVLPRAKRTKDVAGFVVQSKGLIELRKTGLEGIEPKPASITQKEIKTEIAQKELEKYIASFTPEQQKTIMDMINDNIGEFKIDLKIEPENKNIIPKIVSTTGKQLGKNPYVALINDEFVKEEKKEGSPQIKERSPKIIFSGTPRAASPVLYVSPRSSPSQIYTNPRSPTVEASPKILLSPTQKSPTTKSPSPIIRPSPSPMPSPSPSPSPYPQKTPIQKPPYSIIGIVKKSPKKVTYTAEVRKKGEFIDIGSFDSPFKAYAAAKREVSTTASASLRVRGSGGFTGLPLGLSPSQFRRSTKEEGVFIERREKRIKSTGELREITFKGIAAQKVRRTGLFSSKRKKGIFN